MGLVRWMAGVAGLLLAVSLPILVAQGDTAHPVVSSVAALSLVAACVTWGYYGSRRSAIVAQAAGLFVAGGLLLAATLFFLALGAAVATLAGATFGLAALIAAGDRWRKAQGAVLLATGIGVFAVVAVLGVGREDAFRIATLIFSTGLGLSTAMFSTGPLSAVQSSEQRGNPALDSTAQHSKG